MFVDITHFSTPLRGERSSNYLQFPLIWKNGGPFFRDFLEYNDKIRGKKFNRTKSSVISDSSVSERFSRSNEKTQENQKVVTFFILTFVQSIIHICQGGARGRSFGSDISTENLLVKLTKKVFIFIIINSWKENSIFIYCELVKKKNCLQSCLKGSD